MDQLEFLLPAEPSSNSCRLTNSMVTHVYDGVKRKHLFKGVKPSMLLCCSSFVAWMLLNSVAGARLTVTFWISSLSSFSGLQLATVASCHVTTKWELSGYVILRLAETALVWSLARWILS